MASDEYMADYGDLLRINGAVHLTHTNVDDRLYGGRRMTRLSVESTDGDDADVDDSLYGGRGMTRLSIESTDGDDADAEQSDNDKKPKITPQDDDDDDQDSDKDAGAGGTASLPATPERWRSGRPIWAKEYASDAEAPGRRRTKERRPRERWLDRAWEMKKCRAATEGQEAECGVLVRPQGKDWSMRMDMDEVKACRDLGLELPCDWTVEIPYGFSAGETSSGGNSPVSNWMVSSPGENPKDVKARLKSWAQAVALASASRLIG